MELTKPLGYYTDNTALRFHMLDVGEGLMILIIFPKQRFTRGYKRYKETSGLMEWKIGHIFHSIFT